MPAPRDGDLLRWPHEDGTYSDWRIISAAKHIHGAASFGLCEFLATYCGGSRNALWEIGNQYVVLMSNCRDVEDGGWMYLEDEFVQWVREVRTDTGASVTD